MDVDNGAVVPEDVGELVAVAGVDELLVGDLRVVRESEIVKRKLSLFD